MTTNLISHISWLMELFGIQLLVSLSLRLGLGTLTLTFMCSDMKGVGKNRYIFLDIQQVNKVWSYVGSFWWNPCIKILFCRHTISFWRHQTHPRFRENSEKIPRNSRKLRRNSWHPSPLTPFTSEPPRLPEYERYEWSTSAVDPRDDRYRNTVL